MQSLFTFFGLFDTSSSLFNIFLVIIILLLIALIVFLILKLCGKTDINFPFFNKNNYNYNYEYKTQAMDINTEENNLPPDTLMVLLGLNGQYAGQKVEFFNNMTIGRDPNVANLILSPKTIGVSARHCKLVKEYGQIKVMDLSSTYGTFLNGEKIEPMVFVNASSGDILNLGSENTSFRIL